MAEIILSVPGYDPATGPVAPMESGTLTVEIHTPSVEAFIVARRWDQSCWGREPLVQAQAEVLDDDSLAALRARFTEVPATRGWPGHTQYRLEGQGVMGADLVPVGIRFSAPWDGGYST